jgi:hypothetical protein
MAELLLTKRTNRQSTAHHGSCEKLTEFWNITRTKKNKTASQPASDYEQHKKEERS